MSQNQMIKLSVSDLESLIEKSAKDAIAKFIDASRGLETREVESASVVSSVSVPDGYVPYGILAKAVTKDGRIYNTGTDCFRKIAVNNTPHYLVADHSGRSKIKADLINVNSGEIAKAPKAPKAPKISPSGNVVQLSSGNVLTYKVERQWCWGYFSETILANSDLGRKIKESGGYWSSKRSAKGDELGAYGCKSAYSWKSVLPMTDIVAIVN